jgi:hypothetical protein
MKPVAASVLLQTDERTNRFDKFFFFKSALLPVEVEKEKL